MLKLVFGDYICWYGYHEKKNDIQDQF